MATPQASRFSQFLRRTYSLKEGFNPDLIEQIQVTHEASNLIDPSNFRLRGEHLWGFRGTSPAIVGNVSSVLVQTPPGTLCVINRISIAISGQATCGWTTQSQGTPLNVQALDGRVIGIPKREGVLIDQTLTMAAITNPFLLIPASGEFRDLPILFTGDPGTAGAGFVTRFVLQGGTANTAFDYSILGWVRQNEPSENF